MVTPEQESYYDELAARFTDPSIPVRSAGKVKTGAAAAAAGREFMLKEFGSEEAFNAFLKAGRPSVGSEKNGASPVVRGALDPETYADFQTLRKATGRTQAELVREAVHLLIDTHREAS